MFPSDTVELDNLSVFFSLSQGFMPCWPTNVFSQIFPRHQCSLMSTRDKPSLNLNLYVSCSHHENSTPYCLLYAIPYGNSCAALQIRKLLLLHSEEPNEGGDTCGKQMIIFYSGTDTSRSYPAGSAQWTLGVRVGITRRDITSVFII